MRDRDLYSTENCYCVVSAKRKGVVLYDRRSRRPGGIGDNLHIAFRILMDKVDRRRKEALVDR